MIRSAAFCGMPLTVCRLRYAAKYPHDASSGVRQARVRLRAPAHIFERVFPDASSGVQQARVRLLAPAYIFERVFPDARPRTKKRLFADLQANNRVRFVRPPQRIFQHYIYYTLT